jgi:hypothetical protein
MANSISKKMIKLGLKAATSKIYEEDKVWSRFSHDKVDIGEELAKVIRTLSKQFPLARPLRTLSIGSSAEPQFRILETAFRGGLYLFDIDEQALGIVRERIQRQCTDHVITIRGDYNKIFQDPKHTKTFLRDKLKGRKMNLINLHHSLYYCEEAKWNEIFSNLYQRILAPKGAIHAVLMTAESNDQHSTTWLYNHFAGKFFGCHNDQDLCKFKKELKSSPLFKKAQVLIKTHRIRFWVGDFAQFMSVVWMILLYPYVHRYSLSQRQEIIEFIYKKFWLKKKPLIQMQDHLVIYRGINFRGLV